MDSSRSGPLSTLILLLPLIVVPAVAILRPAERDSGFVGDDLTASEDAFMSGPEHFDAIFGDLDAESANLGSEEDHSSTRDVPFAEDDSVEDLIESGTRKHPKRAETHEHAAPRSRRQPAQAQKLPDLSHLGVTRSLRFQPGTKRGFGFVAFVRTEKESVSYRFSSIQETEEGAVDDVSQQIRVWRQARRDSSARRAQ